MRGFEDVPETLKQRVGKALPSNLVAWSQYDACVNHVSDTSPEGSTLAWDLSRLRNLDKLDNYSKADLLTIGNRLIREIVKCGKSPEAELTRVYDLGAKKYSANGWKQGIPVRLLSDAAWRHLSAHLEGYLYNTTDGGCLHITHALWQIVTALWMLENKPECCE